MKHQKYNSRASSVDLQYGHTHEINKAASFEEVQERYKELLQEPLYQAAAIGKADIVVGIPFYKETETLRAIFTTIRKGLEQFFPDQKSVIVAVGSPAGEESLNVINNIPIHTNIKRIAFLLNDWRMNGKGWHVWAIMEIARTLGADLAIVEADLTSNIEEDNVEGLAPNWINLLLKPIKADEMDMVISRFSHHDSRVSISTHIFYPLLTSLYQRSMHDMSGGQFGISHELLKILLQDPPHSCRTEIYNYGIDCWLAITALSKELKICEANLGIKVPEPTIAKRELVLRQVIRIMFHQVTADIKAWSKTHLLSQPSIVQPLANFGIRNIHGTDESNPISQHLITKYRRGFNVFHFIYKWILPEDTFRQLEKLARTNNQYFLFPDKLWTQIVYKFLLAFAFDKKFNKGDLLDSLMPICEGYSASFINKIQALRNKLILHIPEEVDNLVYLETERRIEEMVDEFIEQKADFLRAWVKNEETLEPPIPKVTYREFIPGVPLIVPLELPNLDGNIVTATGIYESIFFRYKKEFDDFIHEKLHIPLGASSGLIAEVLRNYMLQIEKQIDNYMLPGNLYTVADTKKVVEAIFHYFRRNDILALSPEFASWLLWSHPPINLLTRLGYSHLTALIEVYEPNDILTMVNWSEERFYMQHIWESLKENVRPEHFVYRALKPLVVSHQDFSSLVDMKESALNKITGVVAVSNLHRGTGGEFPKLRYLTIIAKNIIEAERFGLVWKEITQERKDLGIKIINTLEGHWGREPLSAHNIFENGHQRLLVKRIIEVSKDIENEAGEDETRFALVENLEIMADSYHLAFTLADGTFIPCSAWTWASFSFKGGTGLPTPLSVHVERDWASREFLTEYYKAIGGRGEKIDEKIRELMVEGREWEDLVPILLGEVKGAEEIVPERNVIQDKPLSRTLTRFTGNPVLKPIKENRWESKYVLNPGAININGKVYIVYRAFGDDEVSRLGLAVSEDGFLFKERLSKPIFEPKGKSETRGCEDPRLILFNNRIYMLYTAYDGIVAQIALASIGIDDFINYHWEAWHRHGLVFPGYTDKNAALFPGTFNEQYAMLHRVDPHMWITFSPHLRCPWPRRKHTILAGSQSGMLWDGLKIGAGAPPIKTKYGWLLITHGVDHNHTYRLGVMLLDLDDPTTILYRSPNPILEPRESYEIGESGKSWVPNVVFSCGAVPRENSKEILDVGDEILIYYGAADTVISVATTKVADLIPIHGSIEMP
jgi:predicted GH43/DUF377 family glycosyl hydrolase